MKRKGCPVDGQTSPKKDKSLHHNLPGRVKRFFALFRWNSKWCWGRCDSGGQSQRDCSYQPWVARNELPRVSIQGIRNPERVESVFLKSWYATLSGLRRLLATTQGWPSRSRANLGLNDAIPLGLDRVLAAQRGTSQFRFHRKQRRTVAPASRLVKPSLYSDRPRDQSKRDETDAAV